MDIIIKKKSICMVIEKYDGYRYKNTLKRLYDVESNCLKMPVIENEKPDMYENRRTIPMNNSDDNVGFLGCWEWSVEPNKHNPNKDFVKIKYIPDIRLIYVDIIEGIDNNLELINKIKRHYDMPPQIKDSNGLMVLYKVDDDNYSGIFIDVEYICNETYKIKSEVVYLNEVEISSSDIFQFNDISIYRYLDIDPVGTIMIRDPFEIVKECILSRTTWKKFHIAVGGTHKNHVNLIEFIKSLQKGIDKEVAQKCGITQGKAREYIEEFESEINNYFDSNDLDTEILRILVDSNEDIRKRTEIIIKEKWESEHRKYIEDKKNEVISIEKELNHTESILKEKKNELNKITLETDLLIKDRQMIFEEFDSNITKKINDSKKCIGNILADSIYINELIDNISRETKKHTPFCFESGIKKNNEENLDGYTMAHGLLEYNLREFAGIADEYAHFLSAVLLAAIYINKPVALAGPNSKAIVEAISNSLYSASSGYFKCNSDFNDEIIDALYNVSDRIVCVDDFTSYNWIHNLPSFIQKTKQNIYFITPYFEDLYLLPAGITNYIIPISTADFVKESPDFNFVTGLFNEDRECLKAEVKELKELKGLGANINAIDTYSNLLYIAKAILNREQRKDISVFKYMGLLIPYATLTGKIFRLREIISNDDELSDVEKEQLMFSIGEI